MTTEDQDAANAPNDLTYAEALAVAQSRIAEAGTHLTALADQILIVWQEVEPAIRAWVARMATLTEEQLRGEPETTRAFYEAMRQWFAAHDTAHDAE